MLLTSAYSLHSLLTMSGISFIKIVNKRGPRTDPCGTELVTSSHSELLSPINTLCLLSVKNDLIHLTKILFIPYASNFWTRFACETLSNALAVPSQLNYSCSLRRLFSNDSSKFVTRALFGTNPCWLGTISLYSLM